MDLASLTYDTAKGFEGTAFRVELHDGTQIALTLEEVTKPESPQRRRARTTASRRREPFSLYFLGPTGPILPQAIYVLRGDTVTFDGLFIVPIGRDDEGTEYEAVFT